MSENFARRIVREGKKLSRSVGNITEARIYHMYVRQLMGFVMTRFKWTVPDEINPRAIEAGLLHSGFIVFYFDPRYDKYMCVRATHHGMVNIYDDPVTIRTVPYHNYESIDLVDSRYCEDGDIPCVPIWPNIMRVSEMEIIDLYAARLAQADTTLRINMMAKRATRVITVEESQVQTVENTLRMAQDGIPAVIGSRSLEGVDFAKSLDLSDNRALVDARDERNQIWNEAMTMLGIGNANMDKKERLIVGEVESNNDQIVIARNMALLAREEACDEINRVWPDVNVVVEWSATSDVVQGEEEGDGDVNVDDAVEGTGEKVP